MATTQIDLHRQGKAATLTDAEVSGSAAIALSKLASTVIKADGTQAFTGSPDAGTHTIVNVTDPVNPQDAATRSWVLTQVGGVSQSGHAVRLASTVNVALTGTQTIDSVAGSSGDRILLKNQTAPAENGIWVMAAGAWARATDMDTWAEVPGGLVSVEEGTINHDTLWLSTADLGGTLATTAITFTQLPSPTDILAGAGMTRTGQTLDVIALDASIVVAADSVKVGYGTGASTASAPGDSAADGSNVTAARSDHKHSRESFAAPTVALGTAAAAGSAATLIRSDATIVAFDATAPSTQAFGDAAAVGSATVATRRDHKHAMPANPNTGQVAWSGTPDVNTAVGNIDDLAVTNTVVRWNGASAGTLRGIAGGAEGRVVIIENVTAAQTLTISHQNAGDTTAANRIIAPDAADTLVPAGETVALMYDNTTTRWRLVFIPASYGATPAAETFGAAGTPGSAGTTQSRGDHVHPMPANPVSYATPAIVLGTAAAAGSATTLIRSDGTIAAFDATVPTTSRPADTAATGSVAFAARRDHTHARETRIVRETPTGSVNGANTSYTLANTPTAGSEEVYLNGILQEPGAGNDYTISGLTLTYLTAPLTGDRLRVSYIF